MTKKLIKSVVFVIVAILVTVISYTVYNYINHPEKKYKSMGETRTVHIPLDAEHNLSLPIPKNAKLVTSNGISNWVYKDGNNITSITKVLSEQQLDLMQVGKTYVGTDVVSRPWNNYSVSVTNNQRQLREVLMQLQKEPEAPVYRMLSENEIKVLPEPEVTDAKFSAIGVYCPPSFTENVILFYTADIVIDDTGYFTAYQTMSKIEPIMREELAWLSAVDPDYDPDKVEWYRDDETFYAKSNKFCTGARRYRLNDWCMIYCTEDKQDYLLLNLTADHPK